MTNQHEKEMFDTLGTFHAEQYHQQNAKGLDKIDEEEHRQSLLQNSGKSNKNKKKKMEQTAMFQNHIQHGEMVDLENFQNERYINSKSQALLANN